MSEMQEAKRRLCESRIAQRDHLEKLPSIKAQAEARAIAAAGDEKALGSNEAARQRALALALAQDEEYQKALEEARKLANAVSRQETDLERYTDERRDREWAIRNRLADALTARAIPTEATGIDPEFDGGMDYATTAAILSSAEAACPILSNPVQPEPEPDWFATPEPEPVPQPDIPTSKHAPAIERIAHWQTAIGECKTYAELMALSIDWNMDLQLDGPDLDAVNRFAGAKRQELEKAELAKVKA